MGLKKETMRLSIIGASTVLVSYESPLVRLLTKSDTDKCCSKRIRDEDLFLENKGNEAFGRRAGGSGRLGGVDEVSFRRNFPYLFLCFFTY
jgi:hypothetical protein